MGEKTLKPNTSSPEKRVKNDTVYKQRSQHDTTGSSARGSESLFLPRGESDQRTTTEITRTRKHRLDIQLLWKSLEVRIWYSEGKTVPADATRVKKICENRGCLCGGRLGTLEKVKAWGGGADGVQTEEILRKKGHSIRNEKQTGIIKIGGDKNELNRRDEIKQAKKSGKFTSEGRAKTCPRSSKDRI